MLFLPGGVSQSSCAEYVIRFCVLVSSVLGVDVWWIICWLKLLTSRVKVVCFAQMVLDIQKKATSQCSQISAYPCAFIQPWLNLKHLVAVKQGRWGITLEGFSHLPFSPSATLVAKGFGASCAGSVSLRKHRLYLLHSMLLQGREGNGIWVPALWAKCHEKTFSLIGSNTDWCAGSICCWNCWNKVSLVVFISLSSKAFFIVGCAV